MRNTHVAAVGAGLLLGVMALQGTAVAAAGDPEIRINPGNALPGSTVRVTTTACGPDVTYGKGESTVAGQFNMFGGDVKGVLAGEFQIPAEGASGTDTVTVKCPPRIKLTDTYEISEQQPNGAVHAGFGDAQDSDTQVAVGGALITAAAAGALYRMRRRSHGDARS
ncbi:sortase [Streptomyces sp. NPDC021080]|uniref:sortase n=1 Tax=Streptomyces sp. NPDC021080 TaxID=3365110 RepID=UPI0037ADFBBE